MSTSKQSKVAISLKNIDILGSFFTEKQISQIYMVIRLAILFHHFIKLPTTEYLGRGFLSEALEQKYDIAISFISVAHKYIVPK
jgi:hypothetical protein